MNRKLNWENIEVEEALFHVYSEPRLEPTNNQAKRTLRKHDFHRRKTVGLESKRKRNFLKTSLTLLTI